MEECVDARVDVDVRVAVRVDKRERRKRKNGYRVRWKREEEEWWCRMEDGWMNGGGWVERVEWVDEGYDVV